MRVGQECMGASVLGLGQKGVSVCVCVCVCPCVVVCMCVFKSECVSTCRSGVHSMRMRV